MARQLIGDMTTSWNPADYADRFSHAIEALVEQRAKAGKTETVEPLEEVGAADGTADNVVDLTALLKQSLAKGAGRPAKTAASRGKRSGASSSAKKPAARKRA